MGKLKILYTQPSYSPFFELGSIIPDVLIHELGHSVMCVSTGWHEGDAIATRVLDKDGNVQYDIQKNHKEAIFRVWMNDTANKLERIVSQFDFDVFISFIGDRIPIQTIEKIKDEKISTLNWDEIDPEPDHKILYLVKKKDTIYSYMPPSFWHKVRAYDAVFSAYYFTPNWMPLSGYSKLYEPEDVERTIDVGFVGNVENQIRKPWIELFSEFKITSLKKPSSYYSVKNLYKRCKIVINSHQNSTLNGRVFEAPANGALLITDYAPGLEECFEIGEEIVLAKNTGVEEVRYFLENPDEAEKIAKAGYERTIKDHQFKDRLSEMIERTLSGDVWTWKKE